MRENKFWYKDIIDRGFKEQKEHDSVYYDQYGFDYVIITKKLTKTIFLDWEKETGKCYLYRIDNKRDGRIMGKKEIPDLKMLDEIIDFFKDK